MIASRRFERKASMEGLLFDLYDKWQPAHCRLDSSTDQSFLSDAASPSRHLEDSRHKFSECSLKKLKAYQLKKVLSLLQAEISEQSQMLIRYLKRRDYQLSRIQVRCNIVTAVLQAMSPKRSVDAKLQFTPDPPATENGYEQWLNAMKAVARLPDGMPQHFRQKLWLTLADHYVKSANIDWDETRRWAFNDRMNPDDDELSLQIVKDLHRTGWSGLEGDKERVLLRRVLLAYARYNKTIGYCQGFNVIAALILEVTEYKEEQALKVMIMLIEHVLPQSYFDQTLRALSVDMAVLRDLMHQRLPRLSAHLDHLQESSDSEFEPPLINVFSMQWFLTLFATCLPKHAVHRVWDSLMLEGSEVLLRAALALWAKIGKRVYRAKSADAFYCLMGVICRELSEMTAARCDDLMQVIYTMAEFPYPGLDELRDKHMWNIQPFSTAFRMLRQQAESILKSDTEDNSESEKQSKLLHSPNANHSGRNGGSKSHRSATDLNALEKQYKLLRQRQKQAAVILQNAISKGESRLSDNNIWRSAGNSEMFNHLYVKKGETNKITVGEAFNGTLSMAPKVVQPSGNAIKRNSERSRRPSSTSTMGALSDETYSQHDDSQCSTGLSTPIAVSPTSSSMYLTFTLDARLKHLTIGHHRRCRSLDANFGRQVSFNIRRVQSCLDLSPRVDTGHMRQVKKKKVRPPPLVLSAVNAAPQVDSKSMCSNGTCRPKNNSLLEKSKAILNSFPHPGSETGSNFNPFPTKRQSTLIERGKRLGLYS